eukprot:NODE_13402_length_1168_cov_3.512968.p1 GENE.NODE_13402_length_1168_cov_3.512968~~NODE_13402_length_1168_cov_3.512968.p1  ORF type:complete len:281 (+),score=100.32 NODE_13402_length_1168_cov_3.512968:70-843(+)
MDLSGGPGCGVLSQPSAALATHHAELLEVCKKLTPRDLQGLMGVSDAIAEKDYERYQCWDTNACKAACLAMDGQAFRGFDGSSLTAKERKVAQTKVKILSGLYGALRPYDALRPYRLEMGSKLKTARGGSLYAYWGAAIAKEVAAEGVKVVINAASQEYWKAVQVKELGVPVVTVSFPGPTIYAKKARGLICRYAVQNDCKTADELKGFIGAPGDTWAFDAKASTATNFVFRRAAGDAALKRPAAASGQPAKRARKA